MDTYIYIYINVIYELVTKILIEIFYTCDYLI